MPFILCGKEMTDDSVPVQCWFAVGWVSKAKKNGWELSWVGCCQEAATNFFPQSRGFDELGFPVLDWIDGCQAYCKPETGLDCPHPALLHFNFFCVLILLHPFPFPEDTALGASRPLGAYICGPDPSHGLFSTLLWTAAHCGKWGLSTHVSILNTKSPHNTLHVLRCPPKCDPLV